MKLLWNTASYLVTHLFGNYFVIYWWKNFAIRSVRDAIIRLTFYRANHCVYCRW